VRASDASVEHFRDFVIDLRHGAWRGLLELAAGAGEVSPSLNTSRLIRST
jgi:hypothetical protein